MDEQRAQIVPFKPHEGLKNGLLWESPLASLAAGSLSTRFCAWRGASDRRYVATVYPIDRSGSDLGLPDFQSFILLAVARNGATRNVLDVAIIERSTRRRAALAIGLARGADEWHVHFLPEDRNARAAMVADLRARHGCAPASRCA